MSDLLPKATHKEFRDACRYNRQEFTAFPERVRELYPSLESEIHFKLSSEYSDFEEDYQGVNFISAFWLEESSFISEAILAIKARLAFHYIRYFQFTEGLKPDGKIGKKTWERILRLYSDENGFIFNGIRNTHDNSFPIITWQDPGGLAVTKNLYRSKEAKCFFLQHWGHIDPYLLGKYWQALERPDAPRKASSHLGVGFRKGEVQCFQYADFNTSTYHAGTINKYSVGGDICQPIESDELDVAKNIFEFAKLIDNPTSRGDKRLVELFEPILKVAAKVIVLACADLDIPPVFLNPDPNKLLDLDEVIKNRNKARGILLHSDISARKWDTAPYYEILRDEVKRIAA